MSDWVQFLEIARFGRPLVILLSVLAAGWALARLQTRTMTARIAPLARRLIFSTTVLALAAFITITVWYAVDRRFYDFAEPTIPAVAWMFAIGKPLYPSTAAPDRYAHIYGPMAFIPDAFAMQVAGPDLRVVKWISASAALLGLLFLVVALRSRTAWRHAVVLTGMCALLLLLFRNAAFWPRPDSLELFCVALGLWAVVSGPRAANSIIVGVSTGILWNLKFSGPLYSVPLFVLLLNRAGVQRTMLAVTLAVVVFALPFLVFPNVALSDYLGWIRLSARNGIVGSTLRLNLEWTVYLLVPLIAVAGVTGGRLAQDGSTTAVLALSVSMLSVAVLASKPGAGPYHLLPFLPTICVLTAIRLPNGRMLDEAPPMVAWLFFGFVLTALLIAFAQQTSFIATVRQIDAIEPLADVTQFANQHPHDTIEVGYSADERMTFVRPALVFRTGIYLLDQPAIQEHQLAGIGIPESTLTALRSCAVAFWLVPKGSPPFSSINRYPQMQGRPLFDERFRQTFFESYRLAGSTHFFNVWTCTGAASRR
jgi:hypothetical protein